MIIFESTLTTFEASLIFWGSWGSIKNWLEHKIEPLLADLALLNPWNTLYKSSNSRNSNTIKTKYGTENYERMGMIRLTTPNMQIQILGILKSNYQLNEVLKEVMIIFMNWSAAGCKVVNKNTQKTFLWKPHLTPFPFNVTNWLGKVANYLLVAIVCNT
jgi:hypothetical protein